MVYSSKILTETFSNIKSASDIIYETEYNWNTLMKAMNVVETSSIEKYGEVIYEAVDVKAFFRKIGEFFKNLLEKIKKFFRNVVHLFKTIQNKNQALKDIDISKLDRPDPPVTINTYAYKNLDHELNYDFNYHLKKIGIPDNIISIGDIDNIFEIDKIVCSNPNAYPGIDTTDLIEQIRGSLLGCNSTLLSNNDNYITEIKNLFGCNPKDRVEISSDDVDIKECLKIAIDDNKHDIILKACSEQEHAVSKNLTRVYDNAYLDKFKYSTKLNPLTKNLIVNYFTVLNQFYTDIIQYDDIWISAIEDHIEVNTKMCVEFANYNNLSFQPIINDRHRLSFTNT